MASSLRLPPGNFLLSAQPSSATFIHFRVAASYQCRSFSQAPHRLAMRPNRNMAIKNPSQPSMKTRTRQMEQTELPNDIGFMPGTFVRPLWRHMPSIFEKPRERLQMEWTWLKSRFQDLASVILYCKSKGNNLPLQFRNRRKIARALQKDMYTAFAQGDTKQIRRICCQNLANNLVGQIEARPKGEEMTWSLLKYLRTPGTYFTGLRIMSDRASELPDLPNSGIRQIVLRITSRQATSKKSTRPGDKDVAPAAKEQDCTEYVVIQSIRWQNNDSGWQVWGHVSPTTLHTLLTDPYFKPGLTLTERLSAIREGSGMK